ncbi:GINS helical bundle-like domain superfamily [Arabidopsis suecica]|uniref:GINS helical bundle-like domain superfamily n=1 Tax=Arabidopsis suecica TaxID=45249 RepID=A0A8T1XWM8_ARASU|nr:GINS helical bundle-like domain superfamily [Arabidopsis suecica]
MASNSEAGGSADYETLMSTSDVELLKRAWRNEKAAPEILQYEGALVDRAKEQIELVEETIEDYVENGIDPLVVSLYQMDLDRTQFLLRSYLRVRLLKVCCCETYTGMITFTGVLMIWQSISKRLYCLSYPRIISRFSSNLS